MILELNAKSSNRSNKVKTGEIEFSGKILNVKSMPNEFAESPNFHSQVVEND